MIVLFIILSIFGLSAASTNQTSLAEDEALNRRLLVLVLDGMPADMMHPRYLDELPVPPTFPKKLNSVFPSLSLPSFASLLTGMLPHDHQLIDNVLYDKETSQSFFYSKQDSMDFSQVWWDDFKPIWDNLHEQGRPSSVYGTNLCELNIEPSQDSETKENPKCVPDFNLQKEDSIEDKTDALLSGPFHDLSVLNYSAVFVFDNFFITTEFQTQSQYNEELLSSIKRSMDLVKLIHQLGEKTELDNFDVIVTGNRAYRPDSYYFVDIKKDMLSHTPAVNTSNILFLPQQDYYSQYFPLYSNLNSSVLKLRLSQIQTQVKIFSMEDLDEKSNYKLSQSRFAPSAVLLTENHFALGTKARKSAFALVDGISSSTWRATTTAVFAFGPDFADERMDKSALVTDVYYLICDLMEVLPSYHRRSLTSSPGAEQSIKVAVTQLPQYALSGMLKKNPRYSDEPFHPAVVIIISAVIIFVFASMVVFLIVRKQKIQSSYTFPEHSSPVHEPIDVTSDQNIEEAVV